MRVFTLVAVLLGVALLGLVLRETDLDQVWRCLLVLGGRGAAIMTLVYLVTFAFEVISWQLTLPSVPFTPRWVYRLWKALMFGSALEQVTPFAGLGGESVKAFVLKRHHGIPYTEGAASLVLARMTDVISLVLFIALGLALVQLDDRLSLPSSGAIAGLALLALNTSAFFALQRLRAFSGVRGRLDRRFAGRLPGGLNAAFQAIYRVENQLVEFYGARRFQFFLSTVAAFASGPWRRWPLTSLSSSSIIPSASPRRSSSKPSHSWPSPRSSSFRALSAPRSSSS